MAGVARMATLLAKERDSCLTIHCGDWAQGSLFENAHGARIAVDMVRRLNYSLLTLGNHEFDWGLSWPVQFISGLNAVHQRMLVANLLWRNQPENVTLLPHWEHPTAGVCFVGVVTPSTPRLVKPKLPALEFQDPVASIRKAMKGCSADAQQRLVVVSHLGYGADLELCDDLPEADVILGGHTHTLLEEPDVQTRSDGTACIVSQARAFGMYLSRVSVAWDANGVASVDASGTRMIKAESSVEEDPALKALLARKYAPAVEAVFNAPAGSLVAALLDKESVSRLLCDAMLWETKGRRPPPVLCFNNAGGVRNFLPDTSVSRGEIMEALPFDNTVSTVLVPESVIHSVLVNGRVRSGGFSVGRGPIQRCPGGHFLIGDDFAVHAGGEKLVPFVSTDYVLTRESEVNAQGQAMELSGRKWNTVTADYLAQLGAPYSATRQPADPALCSSSSTITTTAGGAADSSTSAVAPKASVSVANGAFCVSAALLFLWTAQGVNGAAV